MYQSAAQYAREDNGKKSTMKNPQLHLGGANQFVSMRMRLEYRIFSLNGPFSLGYSVLNEVDIDRGWSTVLFIQTLHYFFCSREVIDRPFAFVSMCII